MENLQNFLEKVNICYVKVLNMEKVTNYEQQVVVILVEFGVQIKILANFSVLSQRHAF